MIDGLVVLMLLGICVFRISGPASKVSCTFQAVVDFEFTVSSCMSLCRQVISSSAPVLCEGSVWILPRDPSYVNLGAEIERAGADVRH